MVGLLLTIVPIWTEIRSDLNGSKNGRHALGEPSALLELVDDLLKPRSDCGAITPSIDDVQGLFKKDERPVDGPVVWRIVGALTGCRHKIKPPSRTTRPAWCRPTF